MFSELTAIRREVLRSFRTPGDEAQDFSMIYTRQLPSVIPEGMALVHNTVRPARRQGTRGFRFWLQTPTSGLERCSCRWARELGDHHIVSKKGRAA